MRREVGDDMITGNAGSAGHGLLVFRKICIDNFEKICIGS